jgi:glycosyltransferase involved in cell wall biosynthesis
MSAGSPRTVLHVIDGLGLSGKTRSLVSIVSRLDRRRFRSIICRFSSEPSPLVGELESAQIPVCTIPCKDGVHPLVALRVAKAAWSTHASIVHCYNPRPMLYGGFAARAMGIGATIGTLSAFACQVPDRSYGFLPQPLATASRRNVWRNRVAAASMRFIVSVSASLGQRFCGFNGVSPAKLRVIEYGVDLPGADTVPESQVRAIRDSLGFQRDDVVIGSIGRLVEQKDYSTELRAFAVAVRHAPRLKLAIAGDGPLRAQLEQLARVLGVESRVRFLGHRHDVPELLRSVDVFALASTFEPFGVVLLEALAAGRPIVATAVNDVAEIVRDGRSGVLVPASDASTMAAVFVKLAHDHECRARLGAQARVEAERFRLDTAVAAYERLYEESLLSRAAVFGARADQRGLSLRT